jgi:hypothetical protein
MPNNVVAVTTSNWAPKPLKTEMWPWYRFADSISMIVISMKEKRTPNRYRGSCDNLVPAGDETLNCIILRNGGAIMARHSHKFSIADDDAVTRSR